MKENKDRTPKLKREREGFDSAAENKRRLPPIVKKLMIVLAAVALLVGIYAAAAGIGYSVMKSDQPISDADLKARMEELIPKAAEINEIIWGKGIALDPAAEPKLETVTGAQYRPVAPDSPYKSTDELRAAIAEVYSDAYIKSAINYTAFDGSEGADDGYELYPRYSDMRLVGEDDTVTDILGVDITNPGFQLRTKLDASDVKFERRILEWNGFWWTSELITVSLNEDFNGTVSRRELNLRLENGEWFLDDPTY